MPFGGHKDIPAGLKEVSCHDVRALCDQNLRAAFIDYDSGQRTQFRLDSWPRESMRKYIGVVLIP